MKNITSFGKPLDRYEMKSVQGGGISPERARCFIFVTSCMECRAVSCGCQDYIPGWLVCVPI